MGCHPALEMRTGETLVAKPKKLRVFLKEAEAARGTASDYSI